MTGFEEAGTTRLINWVEQLCGEDGVDTLDVETIHHLERIYLHRIRFIKLRTGHVVSIPEVFRRCGWWSSE